MAVESDVIGLIAYDGDGIVTSLVVPFLFSIASDLVVVDTVVATGVETTLTNITNYTVTGGGGNPGVPTTGTVVMNVAPAAGHRTTIKRDLPILQPLTLVPNTALPSASLMYVLDRQALMIQDQFENFTRALSSTVGSAVSDISISTPVANSILQYNEDGSVIGSISLEDLATELGSTISPVTAGVGISVNGSEVTSKISSGLENVLNLGGNSSTVGEVRLKNTAGTFYTGFKAPALSANKVYTLPTADGTAGQGWKTDGSGTLSWADSGITVGRVSTSNSSYTVTAKDIDTGTIPTSSLGTQMMTVTITPKNAANILEVTVMANYYCGATAGAMVGYILRDAGANSLASSWVFTNSGSINGGVMTVTYRVAAGSTSATTFKFRLGTINTSSTAGYLNASAATLGNSLVSTMQVTEYTV